MYFLSLPHGLFFALALFQGASASDDKQTKPADPCTVASITSGLFYDLRPLSLSLPVDPKKPAKNEKDHSWHARGFDYGSNFTFNVCAPVVEDLEDVVGINSQNWKNVSAFYESNSEIFSLGHQSSNLTLRGRRLVLQYINGSPCGPGKTNRRDGTSLDLDTYEIGEGAGKAEGSGRKSATISFHCDRDPLATTPLATFVGVDPDECAYSFEILSVAACVGAEPAKQGVGPGAVFAIIGVIAILVYFLGGVFYQRNVAHARGWRQLPNYSMWAGIGGFIKDIFIIATSSCARFMPSRRGYSALSISANGNSQGRGRNNRAEDENRLIDQLDEEWDD